MFDHVVWSNNLETNVNFNFKSSKMFIHIIKNAGKLLNLVSFQTRILSNRESVFQFVSLFGQIGTEKLQNPLSKIIWFHRLYILRYIQGGTIKLSP